MVEEDLTIDELAEINRRITQEKRITLEEFEKKLQSDSTCICGQRIYGLVHAVKVECPKCGYVHRGHERQADKTWRK